MPPKCTGTGTTSRTATPRSSSSRAFRKARSRRCRRWNMPERQLAIVTGASSGIGREIAMLAAAAGYDLVLAADEPLVDAAAGPGREGIEMAAVETDLSTPRAVGGTEGKGGIAKGRYGGGASR